MSHWFDEFMERVLSRGLKHTVESGTSISGPAHIGNACDVLYAEAVCREVRLRGGEAISIWVADDLDPLDSIPYPLPEDELKKYLGKPYINIPDPYRCCQSWAQHFTLEFVNSLERMGLEPIVKSGYSMYRDGTYLPYIRLSLREADKIKELLRRISGMHKPRAWLPYMPICANCGNIATTLAYGYEGDKVLYGCELDVGYAKGCGYRGEVDVKLGQGKLQWRVEWAARWSAFGVTVEPFGKEHAAAGGSYDTSSVIVREVFKGEPPIPLIYEHVMINGRKMSKSKGNILTPRQWFEVAPPETLRFFFFRVYPAKHKDLRMNEVPRLVEEFERAERIYYGVDELVDEKVNVHLKRSYELSIIGKPAPTLPIRLPYDLAVTLIQVYRDITLEKVIDVLKRTGRLYRDLTADEVEALKLRLRQAEAWLKKYAPETVKFKLLDDVSRVKNLLTDKQKEALMKVASILKGGDWLPRELNTKFFEVSRSLGLPPPSFFEAAYLTLIGATSGPWLANFVLALGKDFVAKRFEEAAS
ncbi:MAG: lysine--tRNA ligase [Candidatus Nezhaarchaeales archaeon]